MEDIVNIHFDENRKRCGLNLENKETLKREHTCLSPVDDQSNNIQNFNEVSTVKNIHKIEREKILIDKSRKGSIDEKILELVNDINSTIDYFTTSSCSGRLILFTHDPLFVQGLDTCIPNEQSSELNEHSSKYKDSLTLDSSNIQSKGALNHEKTRKKGCKWIFVKHEEVIFQDFLKCWNNEVSEEMNTVLKVEPAIFHIQCRTLSTAKKLIQIGIGSGFRNCGMILGKDNKITVAIRNGIGMEIPIKKQCFTSESSQSFLEYLIEQGNAKLVSNWERTNVFADMFRKQILKSKI